MNFKKTILFNALLYVCPTLFAQVLIEGYTYESGNRGFLKNIHARVIDLSSEEGKSTFTDENGKYTFSLITNREYELHLTHDLFEPFQQNFSTTDEENGQTLFFQHEMVRQPGYIFDITLAEKNRKPDTPKNALRGALIEVYNNTTKEELFVIDSLTTPDFKVNLKKGNHYTILIRQEDFISKRMEAFVDVEGCILCFEGIGDVRPGVSDNLTAENKQGTLLANVELDRSTEGKTIAAANIYYDLNDHVIKPKAAAELDKIAVFLKDNPQITVELGSHTDARGTTDFNLKLSQRRSESAVKYLIDYGGILSDHIVAQGYGESRLANRCRDGVACAEKEHALNRRTELRILNSEIATIIKSLAEMKREEEFEKMITEIQFGSQIRVSSEDELPDIENGGTQESSSQVIDVDEAIQDPGQTVNEQTKYNEVEKIISTETTDEIKFDISSYTGYKIVVHFSRFVLPESHSMFKKYEDVLDYVTADQNHLYMVGDFQDKKKAKKYLKNDLLKKYPSAYLVGFKDGIRVE